MDLAFTTPAYFTLFSSQETLPSADFRFEYKRLQVSGVLLTKPQRHLTLGDHGWFSRECIGIEIRFHEIENEPKLVAALGEAGEASASTVVHYCVEAANKVLIAMKNLGEIATVDPIFKDKQRPGKNRLHNIRLIGVDGTEEEVKLADVASAYDLDFPYIETVSEENWLNARFGVMADTVIPRETEFLVNARRHVQLGNYRYAILEAAIGLEMSVNEYLRNELQRKNKASRLAGNQDQATIKRMEDTFFSTSFDLHAKLNALLPLLTWATLYEELRPTSLRSIYSYRNALMHDGRLPTDATPQKVAELVEHCRAACEVLRRQRDREQMSEDLSNLTKEVETVCTTLGGLSSIRYEGNGFYYAHFEFKGEHFLLRGEIPNEDELNKIVSIVIQGINSSSVKISRHFVPERHLLIAFRGEKKKAVWQEGRLEISPLQEGDFGKPN
jgi:hypothetical protein